MGSLPAGTPLPKFDNTLGALLLGGLFAMALWGLTCVQTFTYFTQKPKDGPLVKAIIAFLCMLDTFDSSLNIHVLYHYLVSNYSNPTALLLKRPIWSIIIHLATTAISNLFIRTMFARRFYALSGRNIPFTALIMALSTVDLVVSLTITAKAFRLSSFAELDILSTLAFLTVSAGLASDFSVTVGLSAVLFRSRTSVPRTNSIIRTLMLYTVNTGLLVALDAGLATLTYGVMPHNFVFLFFYLQLSKLYLNSYLAMLNAREDLREKAEKPVSIQLPHLSSPRFTRRSSHSTAKRQRGDMKISVSTEVETQGDNSASSTLV